MVQFLWFCTNKVLLIGLIKVFWSVHEDYAVLIAWHKSCFSHG